MCYCSDDNYACADQHRPSLQRSAALSPGNIPDIKGDAECNQAASNCGIPESLQYEDSGCRHTALCSTPGRSNQRSTCFGMDSDGKDPDNQGITGQGARQEPAEKELAGPEIAQSVELHSARFLGDLRGSGPLGSQRRKVASGDIRRLASTSRSLAPAQLDSSKQRGPASKTAAEYSIVRTSRGFGPSTLESASVVDPGHRRRDFAPTIKQEGRTAAQPGHQHGPALGMPALAFLHAQVRGRLETRRRCRQARRHRE